MGPPRKRQKISSSQPAEIIFDPTARQDYLTGFHKRKLARAEHAKEQAVKRAREEKIEERRQMREQRKQDLEAHVKAVNQEIKNFNPDIDSSDGEEVPQLVSVAPLEVDQEEEFVDEDKYTTVTVEPMQSEDDDDESEQVDKKPVTTQQTDVRRPAKQKKKKFRYESKAERKETRKKQKARNHKQALARKSDKS